MPCENGFKHLSECMRDHRARSLGRVSRWHRMMTSNILEDNDKAPPPMDPRSFHVKAKKVSRAAFDTSEIENKESKFSVGSDLLDKLASQEWV